VCRAAAKYFALDVTVGNEATGLDVFSDVVNDGYSLLVCQLDDRFAAGKKHRAGPHEQCRLPLLRESLKSGCQLIGLFHLKILKAYLGGMRRAIGLFAHTLRSAFPVRAWMAQDGDASEPGHDFLQELESLGDLLRAEEGHPGHVSAGTSQTRDEAAAHRVSNRRHDYGDRLRGLLRGPYSGGRLRNDKIDILANQLGCQNAETIGFSVGEAPCDVDRLAIGLAVLRQPF
jgi:hypothetical protein